jgi:L-fuconolactonase
MRIDAHHHVWDLAVRDQPWTADLPGLHRSFDLAELRPSLLAHGVDATVVVQTITVADETPELLALATREPLVAGVVGWVDLTAPDVADRLAVLLAQSGHLVGIRHQVQGEPDPRWLCRDDVRRGLAAVAAAGLVYDLLVVPPQLPAAIETVAALPELTFVLDHAGKPTIASGGGLASWRSDIRVLAALPNVAVKLSGLITEADHATWTVDQLRPYVHTLLDAFGADRVMFGSDWPVCLLAGSYDDVIAAAEVLTGGLDAAEQAAVFGRTAAHWYRIEAA